MKNKRGITLVALIITIIVMLILAGIGISITTGIIDKATYSAFVAEMKNIEEAVNMHIMEKNMETANGEEPGAIFETELTQEDLDSSDFPVELKQEILYVRAKIDNPAITTLPTDYNAGDLTTEDLFFVDSDVAEGKEKAYVYDEQSKSVFKARPTIISGKSMFGHDYGKIIGVQGLLAQPVTPTSPEQTSGWDGTVNAPKIGTSGLIPVTINETTGAVTEVTANSTGWYEYKVQASATTSGGDSHWANAITKNNSNQITGMFVWIPRFAYKITSGYNTGGTENVSGTIDVVFLEGTTDDYYIGGTKYTAHRVIENNANVDVETNYVVHPCFTKTEVAGVKTYNQGEWDEELEGIWVAKFEAGYADSTAYSGATAIGSGVNCTQTDYAKNYYGNYAIGTELKNPVFLPKAYSYNLICISDMYNLSRIIGNNTNTYYNLNNTNSHMMKNSEWGAVAYLAQSKYGRNETEITINNVYLWEDSSVGSGKKNICGITGYGGSSVSAEQITSIPRAEYEWTGTYGKLGSTTGNVYGVYDMSGGLWEYVAGYIENNAGESSRSIYGSSLVNEIGGKYKTIYANDMADERWKNYLKNTTKRGDAIYETSYGVASTSTYISSWNIGYTHFSYSNSPFFMRGGDYTDRSYAGVFAFNCISGSANYFCGWRAVLTI